MISTHVYQAYVIGSPDTQLSIKSGRVTLDAGRSPHVQASIDVPLSDVLEELDPRTNARVRIEADGEFPSFSQHREFDLGLRDRTVNHLDGTVTLSLASDEALLEDWAPLSDDPGPLLLQNSLRLLTNYVLDKAIPGAAVSTTYSAPDVPIPALAPSQNLIRNPRGITGSGVPSDWLTTQTTGSGITLGRSNTGGPTACPEYVFMTPSSGSVTAGTLYLNNSVTPIAANRLYTLSVWVRCPQNTPVSLDAWLMDGNQSAIAFATPTPASPGSTWTRLYITFWSGMGTFIRPRITVPGTWTNGQYVEVTGWRLSESTGDIYNDRLFWDGGTTSTAQYLYAWANGANASQSTRTPLVESATPDALTWKAGQSAIDFLQPLVQRFGLRLVCDESRTWTLRDESYLAAGSLSIRHAVNLIDGSDTISRDSGIWTDARVTHYSWQDPSGNRQTRTDSYALTTPYTRLTTLELSTPYPGPGRSEYAVRRAQGRGREVTATTVADWSAHAEQSAQIVLDGSPIQAGNTQSIEYDLGADRMTITLRTLELPEGSIDLLTGTVNALPGTVDAL